MVLVHIHVSQLANLIYTFDIPASTRMDRHRPGHDPVKFAWPRPIPYILFFLMFPSYNQGRLPSVYLGRFEIDLVMASSLRHFYRFFFKFINIVMKNALPNSKQFNCHNSLDADFTWWNATFPWHISLLRVTIHFPSLVRRDRYKFQPETRVFIPIAFKL